MIGSGSSKVIDDMVTYAHETQHEKIIRGLAIGLALVMYSLEEQADPLIQQLLLDKGPIFVRFFVIFLFFFYFFVCLFVTKCFPIGLCLLFFLMLIVSFGFFFC